MALTEASMTTSLKHVLNYAGLSIDTDDYEYHLDLSGLDDRRKPYIHNREHALQTFASLLLRVDESVNLIAKLPVNAPARRVLASTGVMFALAQHRATQFEFDPGPASAEPAGLFPQAAVDRLSSPDSWRDTFTPYDYEMRDRMLKDTGHAFGSLGVFDTDFAAFVNPHRLPSGNELTSIASVANPWLMRLMAPERDDVKSTAAATMELLGHALDNIREHAFRGIAQPRSLVTIGKVGVDQREMYRLQILDNGIGIPASLHLQRGGLDDESPQDLLGRVVHGGRDGYDPLLPLGRNLGLPRMRQLAGDLEGELSIDTMGPDGTVVSIKCVGAAPSEPWTDMMPVTGTVITLLVPLRGSSGSRVLAQENATDDPQEALEL